MGGDGDVAGDGDFGGDERGDNRGDERGDRGDAARGCTILSYQYQNNKLRKRREEEGRVKGYFEQEVSWHHRGFQT